MKENYETFDATETWNIVETQYGVFDDGTIVEYDENSDPSRYVVVDADQLEQTVKDLKSGDFEFDEFDTIDEF